MTTPNSTPPRPLVGAVVFLGLVGLILYYESSSWTLLQFWGDTVEMGTDRLSVGCDGWGCLLPVFTVWFVAIATVSGVVVVALLRVWEEAVNSGER